MTSIVEIYRRFPTREAAISHLEQVRWGEKPECPYCGWIGVSRNRDASRGPGTAERWKCQQCKRSFSVTIGTIFHNSHVDLQRWFLLISLMLNAKKGLSAMQAARDLEMRRPTVRAMISRIRSASIGEHELATQLIGEAWASILGFETRYEISTLGNVRSLKRGHLKAPQMNERGYLHLGLYEAGRHENVYLHRAVLRTFLGEAPAGKEAAHCNGDKTDCTLLNLRWDTSPGNHADRIEHGTHGRGERNSRAKLSNTQVIAIRARLETGSRGSDLAREFGVSKCTISDIRHERTRKHG